MIQGTMSNAGKSLIAAGLCRIFAQDGYRVAPFKAQNMALNSYITADGLEMGRAQVVQAEAAGVEPEARMNPILLKPASDTGSQVIVNGEILGDMNAREYFAYKPKLLPVVQEAYESLAKDYDIIVIEGAGSPAEINLKDEDVFVNMGMAKIADAPVLLVGDIDRGGVFAQLIGTVDLLEPDERERVKGLVINKFRGDVSILEPGLRMIEERCGIPVVGVAPYLDVDIDDEDSLSERLNTEQTPAVLDIAAIRFPRLANFTDLAPIDQEDGVSLRYIRKPEEMKEPDLIILPGTKNTMYDLKFLKESGLEAAIKKRVEKGTPVFGICGGYQMLGETLEDPEGLEGGPGMPRELAGLGLLPIRTIFEKTKVRTRAAGEIQNLGGPLAELSGTRVTGYEIHMGRSEVAPGAKPLVELHVGEETKIDGAWAGNAYGSYLHGIFEAEGVAEKLLQILAKNKGVELSTANKRSWKEYKEEQYNKLADALRASLDIEKIYDVMRAGL